MPGDKGGAAQCQEIKEAQIHLQDHYITDYNTVDINRCVNPVV